MPFYFRKECPLNSGYLSVPEGRMYLSRISEAISLSAGEVAHRLIVPSSDIDLGETELPVLGEITWQAYDPARSK
ncbi:MULTISPECIES: hypothetical protein [Shigella]